MKRYIFESFDARAEAGKQDTGRPTLSFLDVRAEAGKTAEIRIKGRIDMRWDRETFSVTDTEQEVLNALSKIPAGTKAKVLINSEGGSVKMALGIHNALKPRAKDITIHNAGMMASAATIIAPKGARVVSPPSCIWMVHDPSTTPYSAMNEAQLKKAAEAMNTVGQTMASIYADRTGMTQEECRKLMRAETWMTGKEAIEKGFADDDGDESDETEACAALRAEASAWLDTAPMHIKARIEKISQAENGGEGANGGRAAETNKQSNIMDKKLLIAALVAAGHAISTEATEDQIIAKCNEVFGSNKKLAEENTDLKAKAEQARKDRITAHVQSKVDAKVITAEQSAGWVTAILANDSTQALLDGLKPQAAAEAPKGPRGAAPAPADLEAAGQSNDNKITALQEQMRSETNPVKIAAMAKQCRDLRGHGDIFANGTENK